MASVPTPPSPPASRRPLVYLLIGILIGALGVLAVGGVMMQWKAYSTSPERFLANNLSDDKTVVATKSGLQYKMLTPGKGGAKPTDQDVALVNYEGKLTDGTTFDKSQQPTPMPVAGVVPGFSEALKLMNKGAKYRFWIKPSLGYGDKATGPIPANSVLVFDLELLDFLPEATIRQMQMQRQMQRQMQGQMQGQGGAASPGAGGPPPGK